MAVSVGGLSGGFGGAAEEYKRLRSQIEEWNKYRLSLFELSLPNENLEFFGVMRFYLFDQKEEVQTKCLRISSSATTQDVIDALLGKFFADMKNLDGGNPESYSLYEVLQTGERKLQSDEYPLVVQLHWTEDCREGRFLLKSNNSLNIGGTSSSSITGTNANSKLDGSKRKKKDGSTSGSAVDSGSTSVSLKNSLAAKLFSEKPETSFTKSISDKDAAMQQKRREKVELKMQDFTNANGGPDSGGPLKIYGFRIKPEFNYKSILAGCRDSAVTIVDGALKKFDIATPDPDLYCLVQVVVPNGKKESDYPRDEQAMGDSRRVGQQQHQHGRHSSNRWQERYLDDQEVPWQNFTSFPKQKGTLMFCLVERPPERMRRKSEGGIVHRHHPPPQPLQQSAGNRNSQNGMVPNSAAGAFNGPLSPPTVTNKQVPYLIAIPTGDSQNEVSKFDLVSDTVEIGSDPKTRYIGGQFIQLHGPGIRGHHCILAQTDSNSWTVSPSSSGSSASAAGGGGGGVNCELLVNGHGINETVILPPGAVIQIGHMSQFQFVLPEFLNRARNPSHFNPESNELRNASGVDGRSVAVNGHSNNTNGAGVSIPAMASPVSPDQIPHIQLGYDTNFNFHTLMDTAETSGISDDELPGAIEFMDEVEQEILHYAVSRFDEVMTMFKVAPSFLFYMCARFRISAKYSPSIVFRVKKVQSLLAAVCQSIAHVLQTRGAVACSVAVWMGNCTELYHFIHQDTVLHRYTLSAQQLLHHLTRVCVKTFVKLVIHEIDCCIGAFFDSSDRDRNTPPEVDLEIDPSRSTHYLNRWITSDIVGTRNEASEITHVIEIVASAWVLLRKCRVNAALNLQIFTSILRYTSTFIFNTLLSTEHLCSVVWSDRISRRLGRVEAWAGREGLEVAAEKEFNKLKQALYLLRSPSKFSRNDAESLVSFCSSLNSLQIHKLLENASRASSGQSGRPEMSPEFMGWCIDYAREKVDANLQRNNKPILLDEDVASRALFRMPEDGFATDNVLGLSQAFEKFLNPLMDNKIAYISVLPDPSQRWDVYLYPDHIDPFHPSPQSQQQPPLPPQQGVINSNTSTLQSNRSIGHYDEATSTLGRSGQNGTRKDHQNNNNSNNVTTTRHVSGDRSDNDGVHNSSNNTSSSAICVELRKINNSLGLSIISCQMDDQRAILIKSVMPGGAADRDGRLCAGDEIVQVDQHSLRNLTREDAARILTQTGQTVRLYMLTTSTPHPPTASGRGGENSIEGRHDTTVPERLPRQPPIPRNSRESSSNRVRSSYEPPRPHHQSGRPPNVKRRGSFDNSQQNRIDDSYNMGMSHPYSTNNGRLVHNQDQPMNRHPGGNMDGQSQKVMDYAAATLPRGAKKSQVVNQNQKSFDMNENPNYNSMERRRRGNNSDTAQENPQLHPNDSRRSGNEPKQFREPVHVDVNPILNTSHQNFGNRAPNKNLENYQNFSRRQESETSTLAASYDPHGMPNNQKFQRPYQIQPDPHRHTGSSVSQVGNHLAAPENFPQPPLSWQQQRQHQLQGSNASSVLEFEGRKDVPGGSELANKEVLRHDDDHRLHHEQAYGNDALGESGGVLLSPSSSTGSPSHPTNTTTSSDNSSLTSDNLLTSSRSYPSSQVQPTSQQIRQNDEQIRYEQTVEAVNDLESRLSSLSLEERKQLQRLRLDLEFDRRLLEERAKAEKEKVGGGTRKDSEVAYARAYSKSAADQVETDISKTNSRMHEAQMNFEAKALSSEQQRNLLSEAKLRDLNKEIEDTKQKSEQIENIDSLPKDQTQFGQRVEKKPDVISGMAAKTANDNQFQYLEEQKQRYLQRRQEMEQYQLEKEREKEEERLRRIEEVRWQRELERLQLRNLTNVQPPISTLQTPGSEDKAPHQISTGANPARPPLPSVESSQYDPNLTPLGEKANENTNALQHSHHDENNSTPSQGVNRLIGSPNTSQTKLDESFNNSESSSVANKAKPPLPPKPKSSGQGSSNSGDSTTPENSPEAQRSPKLPSRNPRGTGISSAMTGTQGTSGPSGLRDFWQQQQKRNETNKRGGGGTTIPAANSTSYDKSLTPEERMRLYRQQLQFN